MEGEALPLLTTGRTSASRCPSGPERIDSVACLDHEPELRDLAVYDAIGERPELSAQAAAFALAEHTHQCDGILVTAEDVHQLDAHRSARKLAHASPERCDLALADVVAGEEIPAGDMPDDVVGEEVHEDSGVAALLRLREPADK